jgi:hypothetical protein
VTAVKFLPYPPLQRITFGCPICDVTAVVFSYYPQAYTATVTHRCRRTLRVKELVRR